MSISIPVKALSINDAYTGRRFKTQEYKNFEEEVGWLLKGQQIEKTSGWIELNFKFYLKNFKKKDVSNCIKILEDILVKNGIISDDRFVKKVIAEKFPVEEEEEERIDIGIKPFILLILFFNSDEKNILSKI